MKVSNLSDLNASIERSSLTNQIRQFENAQRIQTKYLQPLHSFAEQFRILTEHNSLTILLAKQRLDAQMCSIKSMRKMLEPLTEIRKSLLFDSPIKKMIDELAKPKLISEELTKLLRNTTYVDGAAKAMQDSMQSSFENAKQAIEAASITNSFGQVMKSYQDAQRRWEIPAELVDSIGALKAMQDQIGKLTLPVINWTSAETLAKVLGPTGVAAQLAALGISPDGTTSKDLSQSTEASIGISRKAMELMTLLSFILAILIPIYQELSSRESQQQQERKLDSQTKLIETLSKMVEQALIQEANKNETRFVVLDRATIVRSQPTHGSSMTGSLFPCEVVKPISAHGKWIQFEYYHWLLQEHQTGWALKKYFKRVPATYAQGSAKDRSEIQETLHLLAIPGMRESIKAGMAEPLAKSAKELAW